MNKLERIKKIRTAQDLADNIDLLHEYTWRKSGGMIIEYVYDDFILFSDGTKKDEMDMSVELKWPIDTVILRFNSVELGLSVCIHQKFSELEPGFPSDIAKIPRLDRDPVVEKGGKSYQLFQFFISDHHEETWPNYPEEGVVYVPSETSNVERFLKLLTKTDYNFAMHPLFKVETSQPLPPKVLRWLRVLL